MFQIALIVFREILEIALVIGILSAATIGVKGKNKLIIFGLFLGICGSVFMALFTDHISSLFNGLGQEIFNAAILLISASAISWTIIWMKKRAPILTTNLKQLGKSVSEGDQSLLILLPIIIFTTLREGTEIVLFSYGLFISGNQIINLIIGAFIGLFVGVIVGFALYYGLIRSFGKYFFNITGILLIFLSAGMVAKAMGFLVSGGFISEIKYPIWDSSFLISENGLLGNILSILIGYIARPSAIQVIAYITTLLSLLIGINHHKLFAKTKI